MVNPTGARWPRNVLRRFHDLATACASNHPAQGSRLTASDAIICDDAAPINANTKQSVAMQNTRRQWQRGDLQGALQCQETRMVLRKKESLEVQGILLVSLGLDDPCQVPLPNLQEVILRRQILKTFGTQKADTIAIVALGTCVNVGSVTPNPHPEPASGYRTHPQICMKSKVRSSSPPTRRHTRKTSSASMPNDIHSKARIEGTSRARPQQAFWVAAGEPQACGER